ncbi:glycosyltransferase family 2 protein [Flavisolibacter ginsenosidimutans]|uniref:Glycosyltransferase family 2 protein n=1 Tax=Flavisolibacter ginsenosidimutans TaxID=661481 RepID=A0A5B8UJD8_9BACT|nr:glycosyltransferase family 2 protein [Flavisolibacter ginsenosidimutans]QEC56663.1 glycosyltransferase family 2 protein [Flavisolibacter ginsenosidimutans]
MLCITTVIITKNEARNIEACIRSAHAVSDDVIVVDCGSSDGTATIAGACGAKLIAVEWQCYGHSRNTGAAAAKHDWILSLDADERVSPELANALHGLDLNDGLCVYKIRRENYFAGKRLRYGTLGFEGVVRLYNRKFGQWDLFPVHEKLMTNVSKRKIKQPIIHLGISNLSEHEQKKEHYAFLGAQKYLQQNKKATFLKRFVSPLFNGAKSYFFQLGFLDGREGRQIAVTIAYYTWLKYKYLHQLRKQARGKEVVLQTAANVFASAPTSFFAKR